MSEKRGLNGFVLSEAGYNFAFSKGIPQHLIKDEFEAFSDFHAARGSRFCDWEAAWRTWVRNAVKFAARGRPVQPSRYRPSTFAAEPQYRAQYKSRYEH